MDKIKKRCSALPLRTTFILLMIAFVLLAFILAEAEKTLFHNAQLDIAFQYSNTVSGYDDIKVWGDGKTFYISAHDSDLMKRYELLWWLLPPITYIVCSCAAGAIFYQRKMKQPLKLLSLAALQISDNELDFTVSYGKDDEMGMLCNAFEKMRIAILANNLEMWRQMEERKRLNAAFSHDLRTPLTVLEGHLDILQSYGSQGKLSLSETMDTYSVMVNQVTRLKNYVTSMNTLQKYEDIPIEKHAVESSSFLEMLNDTATIVCAKKRLAFHSICEVPTYFIDSEIVMQVFENLLSNAIRYAVDCISVTCKSTNNVLIICILDDGKGFDKKGIQAATDPFYSTDKNGGGQHFGLGLNICKILCERHGGKIVIGNSTDSGAIITAFFDMAER